MLSPVFRLEAERPSRLYRLADEVQLGVIGMMVNWRHGKEHRFPCRERDGR